MTIEEHAVTVAVTLLITLFVVGGSCAAWALQVIRERRARRDAPVIRNRGKVIR